jgi:hypothetical protein
MICTMPAATALTTHNLLHTVEGWVAMATIAVALVTASLAAATFFMARKTAALAGSTRDEVKAIGQQIDLERESVEVLREQVEVQRADVEVARLSSEATIRPVLVDMKRPLRPEENPLQGGIAIEQHNIGWPGAGERRNVPAADSEVWGSDETIYFTVPLRNVGPGTAFIRAAGLKWLRPVSAAGLLSNAIVPSGEVTRVQLTLDHRHEGARTLEEIENYGSFSVEVSYTDVSGGQWTLTRAHVQRDQQYGRWYTSQVFIYHRRGGDEQVGFDWGGDDDFVAASGASWAL